MERTICVFGDSLAWGAFDPEGGWVQRLRRHLEGLESATFPPVAVYNLGVNGNATADLLERFPAEAAARQPDVVIFEVGINDSLYVGSPDSRHTTLDQFRTNVRQLITQAKAAAAHVYAIGLARVDESQTMPVAWVPNHFYRNDRVAEYDAALREIAEGEGCTFIPLSGVLAEEDLDDGLHPSSAGHEKIFRVVLAALQSSLPLR